MARQLILGTIAIRAGGGMARHSAFTRGTTSTPLCETPQLRSVSHVATVTSFVPNAQRGCSVVYLNMLQHMSCSTRAQSTFGMGDTADTWSATRRASAANDRTGAARRHVRCRRLQARETSTTRMRSRCLPVRIAVAAAKHRGYVSHRGNRRFFLVPLCTPNVDQWLMHRPLLSNIGVCTIGMSGNTILVSGHMYPSFAGRAMRGSVQSRPHWCTLRDSVHTAAHPTVSTHCGHVGVHTWGTTLFASSTPVVRECHATHRRAEGSKSMLLCCDAAHVHPCMHDKIVNRTKRYKSTALHLFGSTTSQPWRTIL